MLIPSMWLSLLPHVVMARSPLLADVQRAANKYAVRVMFVVEAIYAIVGFAGSLGTYGKAAHHLPPDVGSAAILAPPVGVFVFTPIITSAISYVATRAFAVIVSSPPPTFAGQFAALLCSRRLHNELRVAGLQVLGNKLRLSVIFTFAVVIGGGALSVLLIVPGYIHDRPYVKKNLV